MGPLRAVRPDVVVDTQNGLPFLARLIYGRRVAVLVHHCHREQWPVAGWYWAGSAGSSSRGCRRGCIAATST